MPRKPNLPTGDPEWHREWEYQKAHGENKKNTERAKARRMYDKLGIDRKGKQIDHVKPLEAGGKTTKGNLKLVSVATNEKKNLHKKGEKKGK
jgi:hypothetical protein